jgi:hypothetical protein
MRSQSNKTWRLQIMTVTLSQRAAKEMSSFAKAAGGSSRECLPALVWILDAVVRDERGKVIKRVGPKFNLGAFVKGESHTGFELMNSRGIDYLLALPPGADRMDDILIDYDGENFVLI